MTEIDTLLKIADTIDHLAYVLSGIGVVAWLFLLFKSTSSNSSINSLKSVIEEWLKRHP